MANKPSERSRSHTKPVELNLIPYMDIVTSILIFMLFTSTGLIQVGVINVNAPRYKDPLEAGAAQRDENNEDKKNINLTVGITYKGLFIAGVGGVLGQNAVQSQDGGSQEKGPTIPLMLSDPLCQESLNKNIPPPVSCYDYARLTSEMIKIKNQYPTETKIIIYAQPDVPYEVLVKVMDAAREYENRALFYDVVLSPEIT